LIVSLIYVSMGQNISFGSNLFERKLDPQIYSSKLLRGQHNTGAGKWWLLSWIVFLSSFFSQLF